MSDAAVETICTTLITPFFLFLLFGNPFSKD